MGSMRQNPMTQAGAAPGCPVDQSFDPLTAEFLADPYAILAKLPSGSKPVFFAPSIGYYVITRYDAVDQVFRDPAAYSAAVAQARKLSAETRHFGVYGGSQGGWVAPLTATKTDLDFVIVGYGLAEGVTAQDRDEVEEQVRNAGFGDDVMPKVREITDATARIVKSEWQTGYAEFAAVKSKYEREPWYKAIAGENGYTAMLLQAPIDRIKVMGPALDKHVSFAYDPRPVIETIKPRQLWVLGGADRTAPNTRTIEILRDIRKKRHDLDLVIYKTADHGIAETFQFEGVERHRYPAGMNDMIVRWLSAKTLPDNGPDIQVD